MTGTTGIRERTSKKRNERSRLFIFTRIDWLAVLVAGICLAFGLAGCSSTAGPDEAGQGQLTVLLTDDPFPFDLVSEANVTISRVEAVSEAGITVLAESEQSFNLLELQDGVTATLASAEMPEGTLVQIRLIVTAASVVLTDATEYELTVPSGAETGIKITMPPGAEVEAGAETTTTLDFAVDDSFVVQGSAETIAGIEGFIFTPVVTVIEVEVDAQGEAGDGS